MTGFKYCVTVQFDAFRRIRMGAVIHEFLNSFFGETCLYDRFRIDEDIIRVFTPQSEFFAELISAGKNIIF